MLNLQLPVIFYDMSNFHEIDERQVLYNLHNLRQLVFEVTDSCNLKCKYCGYAELYQGYDEREGKTLSFAKAKQVIDYLVSLWREVYSPGLNYVLAVSFYGGEPLMNMPFIKKTIDYLKQIKDTGKCFSYGMTTNAMLLDKYMDYLVEKEFRLLISLDGDEYAHSYRVSRAGKNSFNRVFRNVKMLQDRYPEYFRKFVMFNAVLHNRNGLESIYRFIKDNFGKTPTISPLNHSGIRKDKINEFRAMYQNPMQSLFLSKNCEALESELFIKTPRVYNLSRHIHRHSGNVFGHYNDLLTDDSKNDFPPTGTCLPFSKKMFITVNGKILPCERIDHDFFYGTVYDDRMELDCKKVAEQHNDYVFKYVDQCRSCAITRQCHCVYQDDNIRKENANCHEFCDQQKFEEMTALNFDFLREYPHYYERVLNEVHVR